MAQQVNTYIGLTCLLVIAISNALSHNTLDTTLRFNTMTQPIAKMNKFSLKSVNVFSPWRGWIPLHQDSSHYPLWTQWDTACLCGV